MDAKPTILEYASPLRFLRDTARPKSQSEIVCSVRQGHVRYTEWPLGRTNAFGSIVFALFTMTLLGVATLEPLLRDGWGKVQREFGQLAFLTLFWIVEGVVLALVIAQSWRQTVLEAEPGVLRLATPTGKHEWLPDQVEELDSYFTGRTLDGEPLAEVQLRVRDTPTVRLFVDQGEREIGTMVTDLRRILALQHTLPAAAPAAVAQCDKHLPDAATDDSNTP